MVGELIQTRQGVIKVLEYNGYNNILVEFQDDFGYRKIVQKRDLLNGSIANPYYKNKNGGYLGVMYGVATKHPLFNRWDRMMARCYNKRDNNYKTYGAVGVVVCDRWHNFSNYVDDVCKMDRYDELVKNSKDWNIDKDLLSGENKIYSPKTCKIIPSSENYSIPIRKNQSKKCSIPILQMTLDGEIVKRFDSMKKASVDTNISLGNIGQCVNGNRKTAGGYRWKKINQ